MRNFLKIISVAMMVALLAGCVADQRDRKLAQQMEKAQPPYDNGAIYKAGFNDRPLFEERRARNVGDMVMVTVPASAVPPKKPPPQSAGANKDGENADNPDSVEMRRMRSEDGDQLSFIATEALVGTIPMTVVQVLDNGNLMIAGGKQVTDDEGYDHFVRIAGVVDPAMITGGNAIQSTQMSDVNLRVDEVRIHSDGTAINFSEGQNTFGNFFHSMRP